MEKNILKIFMEKGFLLDKEMLNILSNLDELNIKILIEGIINLKIKERVITKSFFSKNFHEIRNLISINSNKEVIENFFISLGYSHIELEKPKVKDNYCGSLKLISLPVIAPKKIEVKDFVDYFKARYNSLNKILQERELNNLTSIRKISDKKDNYCIIGAVLDKRLTKNKNLLLNVEDLTGKINILVNQNKDDVFNKAKDLMLDDIVIFSCNGNSEMLFCNEIFYPDAHLDKKKCSDYDELVAFTSDMHIGSKMFLEENFLKFIRWLNGDYGDEMQKALSKKVKYLFLVGDNIDGVGVYPNQNFLLNIEDIRDQYSLLAELLNMIRKDIKIIMCPGQHDGVRVAEPQPIVDKIWASDLYKIENLTLVPNPAMLEIDGGFRILMYHGASMHGFVDEIEDIRVNYGARSPTRIVKEMLKRRHLAPTHSLITYIPNEKEDPFIINPIPDIIVTGDLHRPEVSIYNNILLVASSCWQTITPFEEKVGNVPDPCKVPLFNLKTREIKILDFS